mgnify:CR=1 FL=1
MERILFQPALKQLSDLRFLGVGGRQAHVAGLLAVLHVGHPLLGRLVVLAPVLVQLARRDQLLLRQRLRVRSGNCGLGRSKKASAHDNERQVVCSEREMFSSRQRRESGGALLGVTPPLALLSAQTRSKLFSSSHKHTKTQTSGGTENRTQSSQAMVTAG